MNEPDWPVIDKSEKRWLAWFAFVVLLLTTLPYLLGFANQNEQWRFSGFVFAVEDGNSYLAKMASGSAGSWLFRTPYTAQAQKGVLMFLPYLLLGKLAASPGLHEQLVFLYHVFRLAAGYWMILKTYALIAWFIPEVALRRLGVSLAILGGGLGWFSLLVGPFFPGEHLPLEFYSPETFGFLSVFGVPHLALSRACMLGALLAYLRLLQTSSGSKQGKKQALSLAGFWLLAGFAQPLTPGITGIIILGHLAALLVWQQTAGKSKGWKPVSVWVKQIPWMFAACLAAGFFTLYQFWTLRQDAFLQAWGVQNIIRSPHPGYYLLAYGLMVPYAVAGVRKLWQMDPLAGLLPAAWVALLPVLAYLPVNLQRRLPDGVWLAWVILAMAAFSSLVPAQSEAGWRQKILLLLPLLLAFPSTLILLAGSVLSVFRPSAPVYLAKDEAQAFLAMGKQAKPQSVVLSAYETGNALPAWIPLRVVIGHGPESADLAVLAPQVRDFFEAETSDVARRSLLCSMDVDYVFWGPQERLLGGWQPDQAFYLRKAGQEGEYSWYRVELPCP